MLLFHNLDVKGTGRMETEELMRHMTDERVIAHFATLEIDVTDRHRLGMMFDADGDNYVTMEEFVVGCCRLRGGTKKSDHVAMMIEMRGLHKAITQLKQELKGSISGAVSMAGHPWQSP